MKKWHITITDNETGDTRLDIDTCSIVVGIDNDDRNKVLHLSHGRLIDHVATIACVLESIQEERDKNRNLDRALTLAEKHTATKPKRTSLFRKLASMFRGKNAKG